MSNDLTTWPEALDPQEDLERAKAAALGDVPLMTQPPDGKVTLFRGLFQGSVWRTDAMVRELTGEDEEIISRLMNAEDSVGYVNAVIAQGLGSVGSVDVHAMPQPERMATINQLLIGEKEQIFLQILRTTFGDTRTIATTCPTCKTDLDVTFSISEDIPVRPLEDPQRATYEFKLRDGTILEYRLVTGADQAEATRRKAALIPEQNTIMLSRVIMSVNGKILVDPLHYARSMGAGDRRLLLEDITTHQPGPYFQEVKLPCAECGAEAAFQPGWADLL